MNGAAHVNVSFGPPTSYFMAYFKEFKCHGADIRHVRTRSTYEATATFSPHICFVVRRNEPLSKPTKKIDWILIDSDIDMMCRKVVQIHEPMFGWDWSRVYVCENEDIIGAKSFLLGFFFIHILILFCKFQVNRFSMQSK